MLYLDDINLDIEVNGPVFVEVLPKDLNHYFFQIVVVFDPELNSDTFLIMSLVFLQ